MCVHFSGALVLLVNSVHQEALCVFLHHSLVVTMIFFFFLKCLEGIVR